MTSSVYHLKLGFEVFCILCNGVTHVGVPAKAVPQISNHSSLFRQLIMFSNASWVSDDTWASAVYSHILLTSRHLYKLINIT